MLKYIYTSLVFTFILNITVSTAQNDTSSPYSIFALGSENKTATGGLTGLGNTGIANTSYLQINNFNPASLGYLKQKSFLYEFGLNATYSTIKNSSTSANTTNANLSHIALAFPIRKNWGIGLGLSPYTKVGYDISFEKEIEGTSETFTSFTSGQGGLNKLYLSTGAKLGNVVSVGLDFSYLFGSINELTQLYSDALVTIRDESRYTALNIGGGFQYTFPKNKTSIGGTFSFPTLFEGNRVTDSFKTYDSGTIGVIQDQEEFEVDDIEFPISFGVGITSEVYKDYTASFDFKKNLWDETSQSSDNEEYTNQNIYAFGLEYDPSVNNLKYWNRLKYRFGFNYNTGFLVVSNKQIDSYFLSLGLGVPINKAGTNNANLSYSYGKEGTTDNRLIQENFHKLTLNLNFVGNWFKDRKIF